MTKPRFATGAEANKAGWFSRRHETSEAHREAVERHKRKRADKHGNKQA